MSLVQGTRLGRYEILASLGAGSMGEVYRARDGKLARDVALKIVHPHAGDDADHLARVRREAQMLASLTHAHVAALYELEDASGIAFLVMELVPGETLAQRLAAGPVDLPDALRLGAQIAAAVEAAHERGIIHRDLKPANIKITPNDTVKVLDFGLATLLADVRPADVSHSPTITSAGSEGLVVGTAAYMSPEQARGKAVDRRTDIWAFGCVLFEMLSRCRPFPGATMVETTAAILERDPDWTLLPRDTPPAIRTLLKRCLEKAPHRRLRDIGDARLELEDLQSGATPPAVDAPSRQPSRRLNVALTYVALAATGVAVGLLLAAAGRRTPVLSQPPARFVVPLPPMERMANLDYPAIAISPDGSHIVYVATRGGRPQLRLRDLQSLTSVEVPGTVDAVDPFFSADSRWIGFFADDKLKKVPVSGGAPMTICDASSGFGASWGADDVIVFAAAASGGLSRVPAAGGPPTRATTLDAAAGEFSHRWPEVLPSGGAIMFTVGTVGSWDDADIVVESLKTGERHVIVHGGTNSHYLESGDLLYAHGGEVMRVPFDATRRVVTGPPARVFEHVVESADGAAQISVSKSGSVVYVPAAVDVDRRLVAVSRTGRVTPYATPPRAYTAPRVSPDGHSILATASATTDDLWIYDTTTAALKQLTFDSGASYGVWTPDGARVTYASNREGPGNVFWIRTDGGTEERLATSEHVQTPASWSPDGRTLAFAERDPASGRDIWLLPLDGDRKPRPLMNAAFDESAPRFSPDGRLLAFVSNESGINEVYVAPVAQPTRRLKVSRGGGTEPVWARKSGDLFFRNGNAMMAAAVIGGGEPRVSQPRILFERAFEKGTADFANYDVAPDDETFVMVESSEPADRTEVLHVLLNWLR